VITIITQKRKGRSSIYKTIFHLHVCMTYFCFIKYKNLSNWKLLFQLSGQAKWAGKVGRQSGRQSGQANACPVSVFLPVTMQS
ncbi:MAG: hypothetical protein U0M75_07050, partial [Lachnospiraceae bacterium]